MKLTIEKEFKKEEHTARYALLNNSCVIGLRIKHLRQKRMVRQAVIATELGISIPAYSKIETGVTDINISRLVQIAALFEVKPERLLLDDGESTVRLDVEEYKELKNRLKVMEGKVLELQGKLIKCYER